MIFSNCVNFLPRFTPFPFRTTFPPSCLAQVHLFPLTFCTFLLLPPGRHNLLHPPSLSPPACQACTSWQPGVSPRQLFPPRAWKPYSGRHSLLPRLIRSLHTHLMAEPGEVGKPWESNCTQKKQSHHLEAVLCSSKAALLWAPLSSLFHSEKETC